MGKWIESVDRLGKWIESKINSKRIKLHEFTENGEVDRISALPDCLIAEILSRLDCTKEAIRTGTLSKRWKNVWTWVHTLIFRHSYVSDTLHPCRQRPYSDSSSDFISYVNKTLSQCRQPNLKKFQLDNNYDMEYGSQFNNWIQYAIRIPTKSCPC